MKKYFVLSLFFLTSCYKNHLYVQVENMDKDFLASHHVNTPDYRKKNPPIGQRVIISWDFPEKIYKENIFIYLTVRFWDNNEAIRIYKISRKWGTKAFFFENIEKVKEKKILTYKVEIKNEKKEVIESWKHQFWTDVIDVDE